MWNNMKVAIRRKARKNLNEKFKKLCTAAIMSDIVVRMRISVPLALHKDDVNHGRFAYLGFVNGDGNIPHIVRALLSGSKTQQQE
jgi:hypothetical protein